MQDNLYFKMFLKITNPDKKDKSTLQRYKII